MIHLFINSHTIFLVDIIVKNQPISWRMRRKKKKSLYSGL